jgi:WD40 repeat protein
MAILLEPEDVRSRLRGTAPDAVKRAFSAARTGTHRTLTALLCAGVVAPVVGATMGAAPVLTATLAAIGGVSSGPLANLATRTIDRLRKDKKDEPTTDEIEAALAADLDELAAEGTAEAAELRRGMAALLAETGAIPATLENIIRNANVALLEQFQAELERFEVFDEAAGVLPEVRDSVIENLRVSRGIAGDLEQRERHRAVDAAERRRFEEHSLETDRRMMEMLHAVLGRINATTERPGGFGDSSPYRGLYPFTEDDAAVFFGRDHQTFKLLEHASGCLNSSGMLALTASSGAGKTSLLRAGLFPAISGRWWIDRPGSEHWPLLYLTPGVDPLGALAAELAQQIDGALAIDVRRAMSDEPQQAHLLARQALSQSGAGESARMVLVVDQFEELFTLTDDEAERRTFITAIASIAQGAASSTDARQGETDGTGLLVIGVRSDYLDQCARHAELRPAVEDHLHFLAPMNPDQMRQAITGPAFATGLTLEEGLAAIILDDLRDSSTGTEFSPTALPLLSQAMRKVWEGRQSGRLTKTAYGRFGGVSKALQASADEVYETLPEEQCTTAERLFRRLAKVTRDGRLVRTPLAQEAVSELGEDADAMVEAFAAARLIAVGEATVEIAHDALLRHWTKLSEWLEGDRESLAIRTALVENAEEWDSNNRDQAFLYRGSRLETAGNEHEQRWKDHPDRFEPLGETALRFLEVSRRRASRGRRVRRAATIVLAALLALALVAVGIAVVANSELNEQRNRALSAQLAAESAELRGTDGQLAQLLTAAAWQLSETDEAFTAMTNAADDPTVGRLTDDRLGWVEALEFSPDGSVLFTRTGDGANMLWSTDTWEPEHLGMVEDSDRDVEFSPDGRLVAADTVEGIHVWDVETRTVERTLEPQVVWDLAISSDGSMLASVEGWRTSFWDLATGEQLSVIESEVPMRKAAFAADGQSVFTGDSDGAVQQWDLATGEIISSQDLGEHLDMVWASPTSPGLVIACGESGCHYLNREGGWDRRIATYAGSGEVSPDGTRLVSTDFNIVTVWDIETAELLTSFANQGVSSFAFQPRGSALAGGDENGVQLWDLERAVPELPLPGSEQTVFELSSLDYNAAAGRVVATGEEGSTVWELSENPSESGEVLGIYPERFGRSSAMSPDGELVAAIPWGDYWDIPSEEFDLWDPATGETVTTLDLQSGLLSDLAFSPDGSMLVSAEDVPPEQAAPDIGGEVQFWDIDTGRELFRLETHPSGAADIDFSPDGKALATADGTGLVRLWDTADGELEATLRGNTSFVNDLKFSHDGDRLVAATDLGLSSWDVESGTHTSLAQELQTDTSYFRLFGLSPDGRYAVLSSDWHPYIWDLDRDVAAAEFPPGDHAHRPSFAFDGWNVVVGLNGATRVFDVGFLADPYEAVCEEAGRKLTEEEWATYLPDIDPEDLKVC